MGSEADVADQSFVPGLQHALIHPGSVSRAPDLLCLVELVEVDAVGLQVSQSGAEILPESLRSIGMGLRSNDHLVPHAAEGLAQLFFGIRVIPGSVEKAESAFISSAQHGDSAVLRDPLDGKHAEGVLDSFQAGAAEGDLFHSEPSFLTSVSYELVLQIRDARAGLSCSTGGRPANKILAYILRWMKERFHCFSIQFSPFSRFPFSQSPFSRFSAGVTFQPILRPVRYDCAKRSRRASVFLLLYYFTINGTIVAIRPGTKQNRAARRKTMDRRWVRPLGMTLSAATVISAMAPMQVMANTSTNFDYRKKVIGLSGIMTITGEMTANVTRAQFARMLVRASAYRGVLTDTSNVSVFADVKSGDEYAAAIRIAAEKGWMTGYLGGNFRPSQYVTLNEAAKGILYLLGYTAEDFDGDQYNKRMAQYAYLDLNENISSNDPAAVLTKSDCVNLFYNLMKAKQKNGSEYAYVLDAEIDSDGEINALAMADNAVRGPKVVEDRTELYHTIPFDLDDSSIFLNGEAVGKDALEAASANMAVLYYSSMTHTIWAYTPSESSDADKRVVKGFVEAIYYRNTDTLEPSSVTLDDGYTYGLASSEMKFAFSIYGSLKVGDEVVLIYEVSGNSDDDEGTFTVVDYVEY